MSPLDEEWMMQITMGIDELRLLYDHVCYSIEMWGERQEDHMKSKNI